MRLFFVRSGPIYNLYIYAQYLEEPGCPDVTAVDEESRGSALGGRADPASPPHPVQVVHCCTGEVKQHHMSHLGRRKGGESQMAGIIIGYTSKRLRHRGTD